ncbi:thiol:disulfide interchange protein DsbA/DsbL [Aquabacterium sp.]|uniref:thiol:disulfide interchange protein DsbA/DsbL n=1 Tax=Aquabacterium sp. TaxID=1872578 RepID=UPI0035AE5C5E
MKRRQFAAWSAGLGMAALLASPSVFAQGGLPAAGQYVKLAQRAPVSVPAGKIEVIEFFSYACPHCAEFDPALEAWVAKLPSDVVFRRVPIAFRPTWVPLQKLYLTLEALGQVNALQAKVFDAVHKQHLQLDQADVAAEWAARNGVDAAKFKSVYNSFGMQSKVAQANRLAEQYKIDGVPTLGVNGQYLTSVSMTQSEPKTFEAANALIAAARAGR